MGTFFNSICVPGAEPQAVRRSVERWLFGRGFRRSQEEVLFDLDGESERSAFLAWNDRWTIVFFSHWDEERRLIRELQVAHAPLIYIWVQDGDVWGFDLFDVHGFAGSFSSDPRDHQSFSGEVLPGEERPAADPAVVARCLGLDDGADAEVARLLRQTSPFMDEVCAELCRLLGCEPAAASYDDLETGKLDEVLGGWNLDQWVYYDYHRALESIEGDLDLHGVAIHGAPPPGWEEQATEQVRLSADIMEQMEQMRRRARFMSWVVRPVSLVATAWRKAHRLSYFRLGSKARRTSSRNMVAIERTATATRHEIRNLRHRVRMLLPAGVEPVKVSGKPATVFAFQCGGLQVVCTARRLRHLWEVLRPPSLSKTLRDETYEIAGLLARHVLFELPPSKLLPGPDARYLALHVVQTYRALYVFLYRFDGELDAEIEERIRLAVSSFREDKKGPKEPRRRSKP